MFAKITRSFNQFLHQSRTINNEPLNKVSLIVIILIDIFILINVFSGLDNISKWHLNPQQAFPCYLQWENYRTDKNQDKDYEIIRLSLVDQTNNLPPSYQQVETASLGQVSSMCLQYAETKDKINNPPNQQTIKTIDEKQSKISNLLESNNKIRSQYDSTLLEKIAKQPGDKSINVVSAEKAKQELEQNNQKISNFKKEVSTLKTTLISKPETVNFITFLRDETKFNQVQKGYDQALFWYPTIKIGLQSLFLLPLIVIALSIYKFAQTKGYGLLALITWHLLVIFLIPLILKIFQFLQIGVIFQWVFDVVKTLFGGLLFFVNYFYIFLIPLIGFGIIKFFQTVVFNRKSQASKRVEKSRCVHCARKIRADDSHCPHCGYYQYVECANCHNLTYKYLPYCKHCGSGQDTNIL
jgi:predicted RNA-binding Zn-ribbon protein involved in translation (DUF1610 family)